MASSFTDAPRARLRRRLRLQRGTAMTEFVIVAPFLGLMMAAAVYFRDLHAAKIDSLRQAREQTWSAAYSAEGNCTVQGAVDNLLGPISGAVNAVGGGMLSGVLGTANLFNFQTVRRTSTTTVEGPSWGGGTVGGSNVVWCNEPDYGDGPETIGQFAFQIYWNFTWL
jgi:hypothetical protein